MGVCIFVAVYRTKGKGKGIWASKPRSGAPLCVRGNRPVADLDALDAFVQVAVDEKTKVEEVRDA